MEDKFSIDQSGVGDGLGMIGAQDIYDALYFYYYSSSSTSNHQASVPGGWGPLLYTFTVRVISLGHGEQPERKFPTFPKVILSSATPLEKGRASKRSILS